MDDFKTNYLRTMDRLEKLRACLGLIGLSGCREMDDLTRKITMHGAETYRDVVVLED